MTVDEIKRKLDALGVEYLPDARKTELEQLLAEAAEDAATAPETPASDPEPDPAEPGPEIGPRPRTCLLYTSPLCDAGEDGRFGGDGQCQNLVLLAAAGDGNGKLAEGLEQSTSPVEQKPAAGRGRGYRMLREGKHRRDVACVRREVDAVI